MSRCSSGILSSARASRHSQLTAEEPPGFYCRSRSAHGGLVLRTVNAEIRTTEWYVKKPAVMRRRLTGMDVLKEEAAGHAHSGDGYETGPLQRTYQSYQEAHYGLSLLGRETLQVLSYGIRPLR